MNGFLKRIISCAMCALLIMGMAAPAYAVPGAAGVTGPDEQDVSYSTGDIIGDKAEWGMDQSVIQNPGSQTPGDKTTMSTSVYAYYGDTSPFSLQRTLDSISGTLDELSWASLSAHVVGAAERITYTWHAESRPAGSEEPFEPVHLVGGSADEPFGISGTLNAAENKEIVLPLGSQIVAGSNEGLQDQREYRFTVTAVKPSTGEQAETTMTVVVGNNYLTVLYAPQGSDPYDFDARITGVFLKGSELVCASPIEDEAVLDAFAGVAGGFALSHTWQLSVSGIAGCVKSIDSVAFSITADEAALIEQGAAKAVAFEDGRTTVYAGNGLQAVSETDDDGVEHFYVIIPKDGGKGLGSYALMFQNGDTVQVSARVEGTGGQVSPVGTKTWSMADAWGNPADIRYVMVPSAGYKVASVVVTDALDREVFSYPAQALTSPSALSLTGLLQAGGSYQMVVAFQRTESDPDAAPVTFEAMACDEAGAPLTSDVSISATGTLRDASSVSAAPGASVRLEGLMRGSGVSVVFASTSHEALRTEVSTDGGATWQAGPPMIGSTCLVDEMTANTRLRFVCHASAQGADLPAYAVVARIVDGDGVTLAQTGTGTSNAASTDTGDKVVVASTSVKRGSMAEVSLKGGPYRTVVRAYLISADGTVQTDLASDLSGNEEDGWKIHTRALEDMVICVQFAGYTDYFVTAQRPSNGDFQLNGSPWETTDSPIRVVEGTSPSMLRISAKPSYVINRVLCEGISFGGEGNPKSVSVELPYQKAEDHPIKIVFTPADDDDEYIDITVSVNTSISKRSAAAMQSGTVPLSTEQSGPREASMLGAVPQTLSDTTPAGVVGAAAGSSRAAADQAADQADEAASEATGAAVASPLEDEPEGALGGLVMPPNVRIKKGTPYTFSIYPNDGYTLDEVRIVTTSGELVKVYTKDDLPLISDQTLGGGDGDAVYGYSLPLPGDILTQSVSINVSFTEDANAIWGALDTTTIGCSDGGFISPSGEMRIPRGNTVSVDLTAKPDAGYRLAHLWLISTQGKEDIAEGRPKGGDFNVELKGGMQVYAEFERDTASIWVDDNVAHGTLSPSGNVDVVLDDGARVYFWADEGYRLTEIITRYPNDPTEYRQKVASNTYSWDFYDIEDGMQISAVFGPGATPQVDRHTITATAENGTISPATMQVAAGQDAVLTCRPQPGYIFDSIEVTYANGTAVNPSRVSVEGGKITVRAIDGTMQVHVTFKEMLFHTVRLDLEIEGGQLSATNSVEGALLVRDGQSVKVNVVAADGYVLDGQPEYIEDSEPGLFSFFAAREPSKLDYANGVATLEPHASGLLTAKFRSTKEPEGPDSSSSSSSSSSSGSSSAGSSSSSSAGSSGGTEQPGGDPSEEYDFVITATAGEHGSIEPSGRVGVNEGQSAVFTFKPDAGYQVSSVTVDGTRYEGRRDQWTFSEVSDDHRVHVEFVERTAQPLTPLTTLRNMMSAAGLAPTGDAMVIVFGVLSMMALTGGVLALYSGRKRKEGYRDDNCR